MQQRPDVGQMAVEEFLVRAQDSRQVDLGIVDLDRHALADQLLGERHHRALAQIVGAGLEAQADQADLAHSARQNALDRHVEMDLVGAQNAGQHRQFDARLIGQVGGGAQIFRQARATEREARLQVGLRNIQLRVAADQVHHFQRIDAQRIAQTGGFVGEGDLQCMEVVAAVLHHLGGADGGAVDVAGQVIEQ